MTIPRVSQKRRQKPIKRSRIKKRPRKPSETLRIYGPPARRRFVKARPCAACGYSGMPSHQAHVAPACEKGTGYKADARWIVPLCADKLIAFGCHTLYDRYRSTFEKRYPHFDPIAESTRVEAAWLAFSSSPIRGKSE